MGDVGSFGRADVPATAGGPIASNESAGTDTEAQDNASEAGVSEQLVTTYLW